MSFDDNPPTLLYPDDYQFAAIAKPNGRFELYQSKRFDVTIPDVIVRLRSIADTLEELHTTRGTL